MTACGTSPRSSPKIETGEPSYEEKGASSPPQEAQRPAPPTATSANNALLARAEAASTEGDYSTALAYLERAQRIDPDDAGVYLALARTHAAAGNAAQARAVAERGLLYCKVPTQCEALRRFIR
jgi:Flp pilus assembly protein TadD